MMARLFLALWCTVLAADVEKHQVLSVAKTHAPDEETAKDKEVKAPMPFGGLEPFGRQEAGKDWDFGLPGMSSKGQ
ncbi:unnamed protein product [Symbiodinium pilosum]|uniref:Uncharacterized protein n=1 Tax=Symbiodinium pilosum TaxID=2952 RepID=A0A812WWP8_SYMPI|nr:unnamed protein product [Symbiodinium pilosum]